MRGRRVVRGVKCVLIALGGGAIVWLCGNATVELGGAASCSGCTPLAMRRRWACSF